jgi:non-heme chloroperoxidase
MNPDGSVGNFRTPPYVSREIDEGSIRRDYTGITVPVLALIALPKAPAQAHGTSAGAQDASETSRLDEILMGYIHRWESALKTADASAHVVELPGAHHYMFLGEEADVLREIKAFLENLP